MARDDCRERIERLLAHYHPSAVGKTDALLSSDKFKDNPSLLLSALVKKYGPEPEGPPQPPPKPAEKGHAQPDLNNQRPAEKGHAQLDLDKQRPAEKGRAHPDRDPQPPQPRGGGVIEPSVRARVVDLLSASGAGAGLSREAVERQADAVLGDPRFKSNPGSLLRALSARAGPGAPAPATPATPAAPAAPSTPTQWRAECVALLAAHGPSADGAERQVEKLLASAKYRDAPQTLHAALSKRFERPPPAPAPRTPPPDVNSPGYDAAWREACVAYLEENRPSGQAAAQVDRLLRSKQYEGRAQRLFAALAKKYAGPERAHAVVAERAKMLLAGGAPQQQQQQQQQQQRQRPQQQQPDIARARLKSPTTPRVGAAGVDPATPRSGGRGQRPAAVPAPLAQGAKARILSCPDDARVEPGSLCAVTRPSPPGPNGQRYEVQLLDGSRRRVTLDRRQLAPAPPAEPQGRATHRHAVGDLVTLVEPGPNGPGCLVTGTQTLPSGDVCYLVRPVAAGEAAEVLLLKAGDLAPPSAAEEARYRSVLRRAGDAAELARLRGRLAAGNEEAEARRRVAGAEAAEFEAAHLEFLADARLRAGPGPSRQAALARELSRREQTEINRAAGLAQPSLVAPDLASVLTDLSDSKASSGAEQLEHAAAALDKEQVSEAARILLAEAAAFAHIREAKMEADVRSPAESHLGATMPQRDSAAQPSRQSSVLSTSTAAPLDALKRYEMINWHSSFGSETTLPAPGGSFGTLSLITPPSDDLLALALEAELEGQIRPAPVPPSNSSPPDSAELADDEISTRYAIEDEQCDGWRALLLRKRDVLAATARSAAPPADEARDRVKVLPATPAEPRVSGSVTPPPTKPPPAAKEVPASHEGRPALDRLRAVYLKHDPAKVASIPAILKLYAGRENDLFKTLATRYQDEAINDPNGQTSPDALMETTIPLTDGDPPYHFPPLPPDSRKSSVLPEDADDDEPASPLHPQSRVSSFMRTSSAGSLAPRRRSASSPAGPGRGRNSADWGSARPKARKSSAGSSPFLPPRARKAWPKGMAPLRRASLPASVTSAGTTSSFSQLSRGASRASLRAAQRQQHEVEAEDSEDHRSPSPRPLTEIDQLRERLQKLVTDEGLDIDVDQLFQHYEGAERQLVERLEQRYAVIKVGEEQKQRERAERLRSYPSQGSMGSPYGSPSRYGSMPRASDSGADDSARDFDGEPTNDALQRTEAVLDLQRGASDEPASPVHKQRPERRLATGAEVVAEHPARDGDDEDHREKQRQDSAGDRGREREKREKQRPPMAADDTGNSEKFNRMLSRGSLSTKTLLSTRSSEEQPTASDAVSAVSRSTSHTRDSSSAPSTHPAEEASVRDKILALYRRLHPTNKPKAIEAQVDDMLSRYKGREDDLVDALEAKYGPLDKSPYEAKLKEVYKKYDPSKVSSISAILANYDGREVDLFAALAARYNDADILKDLPIPSESPASPLTADRSHAGGFSDRSWSFQKFPVSSMGEDIDWRARLEALAEAHPGQMEDIDGLLSKYQGFEKQLVEQMEAQFAKIAEEETESHQYEPPMRYRDRLKRFYQQYAPEKLDTIDSSLRTYRGKEENLFDILVAAFGAEPEGPDDEEEEEYEEFEEGAELEEDEVSHFSPQLQPADRIEQMALEAFNHINSMSDDFKDRPEDLMDAIKRKLQVQFGEKPADSNKSEDTVPLLEACEQCGGRYAQGDDDALCDCCGRRRHLEQDDPENVVRLHPSNVGPSYLAGSWMWYRYHPSVMTGPSSWKRTWFALRSGVSLVRRNQQQGRESVLNLTKALIVLSHDLPEGDLPPLQRCQHFIFSLTLDGVAPGKWYSQILICADSMEMKREWMSGLKSAIAALAVKPKKTAVAGMRVYQERSMSPQRAPCEDMSHIVRYAGQVFVRDTAHRVHFQPEGVLRWGVAEVSLEGAFCVVVKQHSKELGDDDDENPEKGNSFWHFPLTWLCNAEWCRIAQLNPPTTVLNTGLKLQFRRRAVFIAASTRGALNDLFLRIRKVSAVLSSESDNPLKALHPPAYSVQTSSDRNGLPACFTTPTIPTGRGGMRKTWKTCASRLVKQETVARGTVAADEGDAAKFGEGESTQRRDVEKAEDDARRLAEAEFTEAMPKRAAKPVDRVASGAALTPKRSSTAHGLSRSQRRIELIEKEVLRGIDDDTFDASSTARSIVVMPPRLSRADSLQNDSSVPARPPGTNEEDEFGPESPKFEPPSRGHLVGPTRSTGTAAAAAAAAEPAVVIEGWLSIDFVTMWGVGLGDRFSWYTADGRSAQARSDEHRKGSLLFCDARWMVRKNKTGREISISRVGGADVVVTPLLGDARGWLDYFHSKIPSDASPVATPKLGPQDSG
ncbi:hypothetical protein DIPPA_21508 [Diplonema papillatum]|nr:hypothetical protein DIPPA_21508 [Diplonema papillatum]